MIQSSRTEWEINRASASNATKVQVTLTAAIIEEEEAVLLLAEEAALPAEEAALDRDLDPEAAIVANDTHRLRRREMRTMMRKKTPLWQRKTRRTTARLRTEKRSR